MISHRRPSARPTCRRRLRLSLAAAALALAAPPSAALHVTPPPACTRRTFFARLTTTTGAAAVFAAAPGGALADPPKPKEAKRSVMRGGGNKGITDLHNGVVLNTKESVVASGLLGKMGIEDITPDKDGGVRTGYGTRR
mmetsp:Transcript_43584/g.85532  ORF Transcript_43584/g.85532 Transcript_43584/m.85532 type:complete len:139 (-) Transcript_43584:52-468(-)